VKILILGLNYAPEPTGIAVYTSGMAEMLVARGHHVTVICGRPYYPSWKIPDNYQAERQDRATENGVAVHRLPHYVPANPSGFKRLIHHLSFALSSLGPMLHQALVNRPDLVLTIAPSMVAAPVARFAALLAGAPAWLHLQDIEVEAAMATGLLSNRGPLRRLALVFEALVIRNFHKVSAISPQMCRKLADKGVRKDRVVEFRNWANINAIKPLTAPSPFRTRWTITTPHVALYSGSMGRKQGIEIIVEAARQLQHRRDLTLIICGDGPGRAIAEELGQGLSNLRFYGVQPVENLNDLMGLATIHLLPRRRERG
jgi:colanic acid biosynthesis glycosyl transferase WcaI